jgi:hypothetical protein
MAEACRTHGRKEKLKQNFGEELLPGSRLR